MSEFLNLLLKHYGMTAEDLVRRKAPGSFVHLRKPDGLPEFEQVIQRLEKAIQNKEQTVIYGDYDVDGLTSTAILYLGLIVRGLKPGYFIPSRYKEGYGLNAERVRQFHQKGYTLIITVDNGVSAKEEVELAKSLGMEVIIIDHHECPSTLPNTPYLFHQTHSGFLDYNCSAASLAFFVASRLMGRMEPYLATLAGIAVFSDIMPLTGNNLELAKISLQSLKEKQYPNLVSLLGGDISYTSLNFNLIPCLNSPGRIAKDSQSTNHACQFLVSTNKDTITYSSTLLQMNQRRKELVKSISFIDNMTFESEHAIVQMVGDFGGLCGLFANRVMREKQKPVLIFAPSETNPEQIVGSLRLPEGYHSKPFLDLDYFIAKGGHDRACGVTVSKSQYYKAAIDFVSVFEKQALEMKPSEDDSILIDLSDISLKNYEIYSQFLPFGEGFQAPRFRVTFSKDDIVFSKNHNAVFVMVNHGEGKVCVFGDMTPFDSSEYSLYTVYGTLNQETFKGNATVSLVADRVIPEV